MCAVASIKRYGIPQNDRAMTPEISVALAIIDELMERRDFVSALERISLVENAPSNSPVQDTRLRARQAECLAFLGYYAEARSICTHLYIGLSEGADHIDFARCCFAMAVTEYYTGDIDSAIEHASDALHAYRRAGDHAGEARSWNWLGNAYFDKCQFDRAMEIYKECITWPSDTTCLDLLPMEGRMRLESACSRAISAPPPSCSSAIETSIFLKRMH